MTLNDRKQWRRIYAGHAMNALRIGGQTPELAAEYCVSYAEALLDKLEQVESRKEGAPNPDWDKIPPLQSGAV